MGGDSAASRPRRHSRRDRPPRLTVSLGEELRAVIAGEVALLKAKVLAAKTDTFEHTEAMFASHADAGTFFSAVDEALKDDAMKEIAGLDSEGILGGMLKLD